MKSNRTDTKEAGDIIVLMDRCSALFGTLEAHLEAPEDSHLQNDHAHILAMLGHDLCEEARAIAEALHDARSDAQLDTPQ